MVNECCGETFEEACLSLSLSLSLLILSLSLSLLLSNGSFGLFVCLLHYYEHSDQFLFFSLVAAASTAPDTTPKVTLLETRCPLFSVRKEGKKTKTCSFFLELSSVGASLAKIRITKQANREKSTSSPSHKRRSCATARSPAANRPGLAPFRTLTQFMQVIYSNAAPNQKVQNRGTTWRSMVCG